MDLAALCRESLEAVVAIDSASDERSPTVPSTTGQLTLARHVGDRLAARGLSVETDPYGCVLAALPGRGIGVGKAPIALLVHLDTARGTKPQPSLRLRRAWDGRPLDFAANPSLRVDIDTYPATRPFVGHDILHGPGDNPFGLDDKLGLAHLLVLVELLRDDPSIPHPPLLLCFRPDEEIGRHEALHALADVLHARSVVSGYTIDGIAPFEVNFENFEAAMGSVWLSAPSLPTPEGARPIAVRLGGVNTHGATAMAEGHRAAIRLAAEVADLLLERGEGDHAVPVSFQSDALRDCDADTVWLVDVRGEAALRRAVDDVMTPHLPRGGSFAFGEAPTAFPRDGSALSMLRFVTSFLLEPGPYPKLAEESSGRNGYSHPFRAGRDGEAIRLDIRLRDFDVAGLEARKAEVLTLGERAGATHVATVDQYVNMGPRMQDRLDLVDRAVGAARRVGVEPVLQPIRGGTGVDPFLDRGTAIANLGTGYFAPESEKELTSLQWMALHARWLVELVRDFAVA